MNPLQLFLLNIAARYREWRGRLTPMYLSRAWVAKAVARDQ
jgi:hypothetical protein